MLTKLTIRNFKLFEEVTIELDNPVIFVGPNNSGKSTVLQALSLWELGLKRWSEKRADRTNFPAKRTGVAINRLDLITLPLPSTRQLWRALKVRKSKQGETGTENVRIEIIVEGVNSTKPWSFGLEFDYASPELIHCRPIIDQLNSVQPTDLTSIAIGYLTPMSGLSTNEVRLEQGAIDVRIGEGRTAEVLRNLCFHVAATNPMAWKVIVERIETLFGISLLEPHHVVERGEISMCYRHNGFELDLAASGRGLQQTLLLLVYMYYKSASVLLLDEPDVHLELLHQRRIYHLLTEVSKLTNSQVIIASHSEVILDEAADTDLVIVFDGKPHTFNDQKSQLRKALKQIDWRDYYLAKTTGWILYLEGFTDLAMLRAFASRLKHQAAIEALESPFVITVGNVVKRVAEHFYGILEASPDIRGIALFDHLEQIRDDEPNLRFLTWTRKEIENYVCSRNTLEKFAYERFKQDLLEEPIFAQPRAQKSLEVMQSVIDEVAHSFEILGKGTLWDNNTKASSEVLEPILERYFKQLKLPNRMEKKKFYELVPFVPDSEIDHEIKEKLDAIVAVANGDD